MVAGTRARRFARETVDGVVVTLPRAEGPAILKTVGWVGIDHVNVRVDSLSDARRFYLEVMGFGEVPRPDVGSPGAWFQVGRNQLHVTLDDDHVAPERQHFAVAVDDWEAVVDRLGHFGSDVKTIVGDFRQAIVRDPAGNLIEIVEAAG